MTVNTYFNTIRSSGNIAMSGVSDSVGAPTQRGKRTVGCSSGSTFVAWPSGTLEGDTAVFICSSGWDFNGTSSGLDGIRTELLYTGGSGTPVSGWVFYLTVTAAMITAGGVTLISESSTSNGMCCVATFAPGVSVSILDWFKPNTVGPHNLNAGGTGKNDVFLFFAFNETGSTTVDFANVGEDDLVAQASGSGAFTDHNPSSRLPVETVTFGSVTRGAFVTCVRVSKDSADSGLSIASKAAGTATVGSRFISGPTYFEVKVDALVGVMGIGIAAGDFNYNNQMGTDRQAFMYQSNGQVRIANATLTTIANYTAGDRVDVAFHPGAKLVWFRVNGGSWNNDGTANPATLVGGISLNDAERNTGNAYWPNMSFPACSFSTLGGGFTGTFKAADFLGTPPAGYNSIEETVVGPVRNSDPMGIVPMGEVGDRPTDWFCQADLPEDNHSSAISFPAGPVKTIAGEVQESGVGVEGRLVRLYNKRTGDFVGEARTNATGDFVIPAQDPTLPHFVVAFDDPEYNAKVYDNVIPQ